MARYAVVVNFFLRYADISHKLLNTGAWNVLLLYADAWLARPHNAASDVAFTQQSRLPDEECNDVVATGGQHASSLAADVELSHHATIPSPPSVAQTTAAILLTQVAHGI